MSRTYNAVRSIVALLTLVLVSISVDPATAQDSGGLIAHVPTPTAVLTPEQQDVLQAIHARPATLSVQIIRLDGLAELASSTSVALDLGPSTTAAVELILA